MTTPNWWDWKCTAMSALLIFAIGFDLGARVWVDAEQLPMTIEKAIHVVEKLEAQRNCEAVRAALK